MSEDPRWPRASAWLAGGHTPDPVATLTVMDVPIHVASISKTKAYRAPKAIRKALDRFSTWDGERDIRAVAATAIGEGGLSLVNAVPEEAADLLLDEFREATPDAWVLLGGDNSITRPGVLALDVPLEDVGLITLDAHHDLRETSGGLTNGNPVRALLEDGLPGTNVVQIGIQPFANSPAYAAVAREAGIHVVTTEDVRLRGIDAAVGQALETLAARTAAIYVDLDMDVLDRAFAPACPGSRPGGLMPWELHRAAFLSGAHPKVRAIDIVEVDPSQDVADATILAAAQCLLSFASGLVQRRR